MVQENIRTDPMLGVQKKLRIAHVAPLFESVPPKFYGGTERVVYHLTEELIRLGHEVTVFASGDSATSARLIPVCDRSLRLDPDCVDPIVYHILQLQLVQQMRREFDLVHYHTDYLHYPTSQLSDVPYLTTLHGRLDIPELKPLYAAFSKVPLVSISFSQRKPFAHINWVGNVYHGLPLDRFKANHMQGKYLAFLGRVSREKGIEHAVEIARQANMPLRIAAKIDKADREYFERNVRHLFDLPFVEYIGEIGEKEKNEFLGNAAALVFPIQWEEPFGLVMVEAMACGTPVVAYGRGSVPEVITHGENGFIVSSVPEAVEAIHHISLIDRAKCRACFEARFTSSIMANEYLKVYERLIGINEVRTIKINVA